MPLIDFGLLDPNAMFRGAANTNAMMQTFARQKAGQALAKGDRAGATKILQEAGDIQGANDLNITLDEKDERLQKMQAQHRQESTQMLIDVAHVLNVVRHKDGDKAVVPAFDQMAPIFRQRGATDQELDQWRGLLSQNPGQVLERVSAIARQHSKTYTMTPGQERRSEFDNSLIASRPGLPRTVNTPAGGQTLQLPDAGPSVVAEDQDTTGAGDDVGTLPEEAVQHLTKGAVTRFGNGQAWTIGDDDKPMRVE